MTQWSEDQTFWEAMEPALCAPSRLALAATDVPAILTMVEARPDLYTSFGYFDDAGNRRVLENVYASLAPHGAFVLDLTGRETAARYWQERRWHEVDGVLYLERCASADDWASMVSDWIVIRKGVRAEFRVKQRLYSSTELRGLLRSVGFDELQVAGGLDRKAPYDESARRLVVVGRRPGDR